MNVEKNALKSKREIVNQKIKNRTYLDTIEKRKLITLNLTYRSQPILAYLIEKYIYFFNSKLLNSKGEFYQSYDDIALGVISNLSYHLIKKSLDELTEKGYITRVLKIPEGVKTNIPKYHFILNFDKLNDILISTEEYKLPNNKKYEIQQNIKYAHSADDNPTKAIEDTTATTEPTIEPKNEHEEVNKAQLLIDHKDKPKIKHYLDGLKLTNYDIKYLLSDDYIDGSDKELDKKKNILNMLAEHYILQPISID